MRKLKEIAKDREKNAVATKGKIRRREEGGKTRQEKKK